MVYNRRHPTEQYRISLKLTSGAVRTFFLSPGSKNAYPFGTLEDKITTFLQVRKKSTPFTSFSCPQAAIELWLFCKVQRPISHENPNLFPEHEHQCCTPHIRTLHLSVFYFFPHALAYQYVVFGQCREILIR